MSKETYVKLCERLNRFESKVPPVDAFYELLQELYTMEEAETAIRFPDGALTIDELSAALETDNARLHPLVETMADKGHVFVLKSDDGASRYELAPWFPGVIEFSIMRLLDDPTAIQRFMELEERMRQEADQLLEPFKGNLDAIRSTLAPPQLRTLVIEQDLPPGSTVYSYESLLEMVDQEESFGVQPCCCRELAAKRGEPCKHAKIPKYSCMVFGKVADYVIERNFGKRITKQEIKDLIKVHAEAGVVFNANNFTEGLQYVCGCCGCCCGVLARIKTVGNFNSAESSNFRSSVDEDACIGCGECVERCPVEAISMEDDLACVNAEICLGCGSCIAACPVEALTMQRKSDKKAVVGDRIIGLGSAAFSAPQNPSG